MMLEDDDDDMPLPDQFLSQLDLIESQAMASMKMEMELAKSEKENSIDSAEVSTMKKTVEDYKRQIENLQEHEMSLQGEATMLRQRLESKQKETETTRMEMLKSIDQINYVSLPFPT